MSKLLKSKSLLGFVIVAVMFVGAFALATSASAFTYTSLLKQGSTGSQVLSLQQALNANGFVVSTTGAGSPGLESSYFGTKTKSAVQAFQASKSLTADGVVGPMTGAALGAMTGSMTYPAGCTSSSGFSTTTGLPCNTGTGTMTYPAGCTSSVGYSPTTGVKCDSTGTVVPTTGPVSVSLSSDNPASGSIVAGQATADLMHITFTGSGTVNSVTLTRGGVSDQNTLTNVYLYDGVTRLTDGFSFNTNGTLTMSNLNLVVNGSKTISVKADVYASTTSYDIFVTLTSYSADTSVNTVSIKGNDMFIAGSGSLATASVSGANTVSAASVNAGSTSYTVWRAPVQVNTRTLMLKAANFRITGSAPSDALQNVGLYVDGVKVGNNAMMTMTNGSNYLSFDMTASPLSLTTGSHTVEVRGDVVKGSSYNLTVSLQQASDLMVMDPQIGVNVALSGTIPNTAGLITIGTGSYTNVVDPTFSSFSNVTAGASNVAIAKFKLHGYGEDVKVTSLPVTPVFTGGTTPAQAADPAGGLQNVTLYFNGSQVGTQQSWYSGALTFNLGSQMIVPAGQDSYLEVRADLRTKAGVNYTAGQVSANLGNSTAEGWTSHASITGSTATGNVLTMQSGTLGLSKNAGYSNQSANPNTAGVKIGSYVLQNQSTSEGIRVTSLAVNIAYGAGTSSANLAGLRTSEISGNAGTPVQPATAAASSNATNTFSSDFVLTPGEVKTIDIFADSASDAGGTATVISTLTVTSLGTVSNVSATSSATTGQTITFQTGTLGTPTIATASSTVAQLIAAANGGTADGSKAVYNFTSASGSANVTELTFTSTNSAATFVKVDSVSAPVVGGTAYLTGLNIAVPNGGSGVNVDVFVSYPEVGTNGIASTTTNAITLTTIKSVSGNTTTTSTVSVAAPTMTLVGSKPSFTVTDSSDTLSNSQVKIAEVTVFADAKGDIKLGKLPISVTSTGVATVVTGANNIVVKDTNDTVVVTTNTGLAVSAGGTGTDTIIFGTTAATSYLIPAGTSKTFRIYATPATVSGAVNTTSLSTKLGAAASVEWYDVAGNNTVLIDASSVFNYPTTTSVITN